MLTAACLALLFATLTLVAWCGYHVGRSRRPRSEGYLAARATGWRDGIRHGEAARTALSRQLDQVTADRDRLDEALEEMNGRYVRLAAQRYTPIARAITVDDHEEAGL